MREKIFIINIILYQAKHYFVYNHCNTHKSYSSMLQKKHLFITSFRSKKLIFYAITAYFALFFCKIIQNIHITDISDIKFIHNTNFSTKIMLA